MGFSFGMRFEMEPLCHTKHHDIYIFYPPTYLPKTSV